MSTRGLQISGLVCLLAAIVVGGVAAALEARRASEYYSGGSGDGEIRASPEPLAQSTATIKRLILIAAPLLVVGSLLCWVACSRQRLPDRVPPRSRARYSAAKLCLAPQSEPSHRRSARSRHPTQPGASILSL